MAEETEAELMERVKKMSPDELLEFQKSRCIFCHIISGKVQSKKIYDDVKVSAILDINPANPGHILLMPKEHYAIMPQVPDEVLDHMAVVIKRLSHIALQALGVKGVNILIQNGIAAGQKAQHFMVHIIPRKQGDGLNLALDKKSMSDADYEAVKGRLKKKVYELFGKPEPTQERIADIKETNDGDSGEPEIAQPSVTNIINVDNTKTTNSVNTVNSFTSIQDSSREQFSVTQSPGAGSDTLQFDDIQDIEPIGESSQELLADQDTLDKKEETYWTSAKAKRYHTPKCPFAQNIPKEKLIVLDEGQAIASGRKACTCVSGKKIPLTPSQEKISETIAVANEQVEELNEEIHEISKDLNIEQKEKEKKAVDVDLDRIARLLGGRR
jgi:histidine triad (HIT) family protein